MTTMLVLDASGNPVSIEKPLTPGRAAAVSSRPVVLSTEDKAALDAINTALATLGGYVDGLEALATALNTYVDGIETINGAVNETAPATDTASSGLNGRLQRIAQRLTTLLGAGATTIAKAEDAASADADVGVPAMAIQKATPADTAGTDGDYAMLQMKDGRLWTASRTDASAAAGGITDTARLASSAASTNAVRVKNGAGRIYTLSGKNNAAYDVFLVLYDSTSSPPVPGTTTIRRKVVCPAGQAFVYDFPLGLYFATGIGYAFTKLVADADTTALASADITAFNMDYC